jgi:hypothetical protein
MVVWIIPELCRALHKERRTQASIQDLISPASAIAEFLSDDLDVIERRKLAIAEAEWDRAIGFGELLVSQGNFLVRDGRPLMSMRARRLLEEF